MQGRLFSLLGAAIALGVWFAVLSGGAAAIRGRDSQPAAGFQLETPDMTLDIPGEAELTETDEMVPSFPNAGETPATSPSVTPGTPLETPGSDGANAAPAASDNGTPVAAVRTVDPAGFSLPADVQGKPLERLPALTPDTQQTESKPRSLVLRRPVVLAAGHIRFGAREIRLAGIDGLDDDRRCDSAGGTWDCGKAAKLAFRNYLRARAMVCSVPRAEWTGSIEASCTVAGEDPARWLAEQGWAEAAAGSTYAALTDSARRKGLGLFATTPPQDKPADLPGPVADVATTPELTEPLDALPLAGAAATAEQ
ncbi:hypothetical protein SAMN05880582_102312 [Rhizobium sp. RU20A]|uniref:thermonuclease family protein n=1 Tax=Rhizobium sp. RU20A TaxID=1907412 RepID=UPI0009549DB7|nr:hypothetical protein [Rhizobium sp. RU20A]SIQ61675.1 hypothetical protein SAMN05880582_102312 [Rhizobium sp. RU20A]